MNLNWNQILPPSWLRWLCIIVLILGLFFRFINLDNKVYWVDESATSLRLSGYSQSEFNQENFNNKVSQVADFKKYQTLNSDKTMVDTIKGLAKGEPQLPPLYYALLRLWVSVFGDSIGTIRCFSAAMSLLAFPGLFWLCWELFNFSLVSWIAVSLISVSPLFVIYAQEARLYSLWIGAILLSNAALIRAIRVNSIVSWAVYIVTLSLALYTNTLSILVAIGQGIYVIITQGALTKRLKWFLGSAVVIFLLFLPWVIAVLLNLQATSTVTSWTSLTKVPWPILIFSFCNNIIRVFFDIPSYLLWKGWIGAETVNPGADILAVLIGVPILILVGYSFYFLIRNTNKTIWLFVILSGIIIPTLLMLLDFSLGGIRSIFPRYQFPFFISVIISMAYLASTHLSPATLNQSQGYGWGKLMIITLFSLGVISSAIMSPSNVWWNKYFSADNLPISRIINESPSNTLVVVYSGSDSDLNEPKYYLLNFLSLTHLLKPNVNVYILPLG